MKILGIDPGSIKAGYALIQVEGRKFNYLDSGVLFYPKSTDFISRLGIIYNSCNELICEFKPDHISIESLVFVKNISSLAKLAQARGAMLAAFNSTHNEKIYEYSPTMVKSSVSGHGHSDKLAVEKSLGLIFGKLDFKTDDESDALAIALTHALQGSGNSKINIRMKRGMGSMRDAFNSK